MQATEIIRIDNSPAARFAASELRRYLVRATDSPFEIRRRKRFDKRRPAFWLGCFSQFQGAVPDRCHDDPDRDAIVIRVGTEGGIIAGSNGRSVLLGVYRCLTEMGFRWVRPGPEGEFVPDLSDGWPEVGVDEQASYGHRGLCIEGAVSYEHVRDVVDWLPKLGMNAYYIQFREAYNFFQRWYEHTGNPHWRSRRFTVERARQLTRRLRGEIRKRSLEFHMVGHGWTCEPFGIPGTGWFPHEGELPPEAIPYLAEVNGQRGLWQNIALNTNLCYGNPETREIVTDAIVQWATENPDVDVIHFWLADGSNNQCECGLCRDQRTADLYVRMLNLLDEKLTAHGLGVKIVFLIYVDLFWPPVSERIRNTDRFILMFAPITRSYSEPFSSAGAQSVDLPPYVRNHLTFPRDPATNVAFLRAWQEQFAGDSFDFDYHLMWDHYRDPGYYASAGVLHQDLQRLKDIGLNGFISCQVQRAFFPHGLPMTVLGRTLWNRDTAFDAIAHDYFQAAYGTEHADAVQAYFLEISELFNPPLLRGERDAAARKAAAAPLGRVKDAVARIRREVPRPIPEDACRRRSWQDLERHGELCVRFAAALTALYEDRDETARSLAWDMIEWVRRQEPVLHPGLDVFEWQQVLAPMFGISREELNAR